jgi:hypothetical protein
LISIARYRKLLDRQLKLLSGGQCGMLLKLRFQLHRLPVGRFARSIAGCSVVSYNLFNCIAAGIHILAAPISQLLSGQL